MGEYLKINGQSVKVGTCENLYYFTFEHLARQVNTPGACEKVEGNAPPREYIKPGWRYRFPFLDENGDAGRTNDPEWMQVWQGKSPVVVGITEGMEHMGASAKVEAARGKEMLYGTMTIRTACPQSEAWKGATHPKNLIGICQQKGTIEGGTAQLWTVVCCPFCGAKSRLQPEYAEGLAAEIAEHFKNADALNLEAQKWLHIAAKIRQGYAPGNPFEVMGNYQLRQAA